MNTDPLSATFPISATWPSTVQELERVQRELVRQHPEPWEGPSSARALLGAAFVCFEHRRQGVGAEGDRAWAAAAVTRGIGLRAKVVLEGVAGDAFRSGWLALREGPLLERAVRTLEVKPEVVLVDATGRDHPRGAGLALHLGQMLEMPTVGVTRRPLVAEAATPALAAGSTSPLVLDGEVVGYLIRPAAGMQPIAVHAAWRTSPEIALRTVQACLLGHRTPEPLRQARQQARQARARAP